jgi:hypothetical protein
MGGGEGLEELAPCVQLWLLVFVSRLNSKRRGMGLPRD